MLAFFIKWWRSIWEEQVWSCCNVNRTESQNHRPLQPKGPLKWPGPVTSFYKWGQQDPKRWCDGELVTCLTSLSRSAGTVVEGGWCADPDRSCSCLQGSQHWDWSPRTQTGHHHIVGEIPRNLIFQLVGQFVKNDGLLSLRGWLKYFRQSSELRWLEFLPYSLLPSNHQQHHSQMQAQVTWEITKEVLRAWNFWLIGKSLLYWWELVSFILSYSFPVLTPPPC